MQRSSRQKRPDRKTKQLNAAKLREIGLTYVARYATSRLKLRRYLARKIGEAEWTDEKAPDVDHLVNDFTRLGYVDDRAFATSKLKSLAQRGYGEMRTRHTLRGDGIDEDTYGEAHSEMDMPAYEIALRYAQRRRLGPFARAAPDAEQYRKHIASMMRAGHSIEIVRKILDLERKFVQDDTRSP
jgi:regulatory protein